MLKLSFNGSDERVAASLREKGPRIVQAVMRKMDGLMIELQGKIVGEKLQGQVLQHRTGKLAGSIRAIPAVQEGSSIVGTVEGAGGPAFYGRIHEYGGVVEIPEYQRRITGGAKAAINAKLSSRTGTTPGTVRAHSANFPERSFMRSSLAEFRQRLFEGLTASVHEELAK
jgi:phage gpG-like protein